MNTSKLAVDHNLSRRIAEIKVSSDMIVVKVIVRQPTSPKDDIWRSEEYSFFFAASTEVETLNSIVGEALKLATLEFLGTTEGEKAEKVEKTEKPVQKKKKVNPRAKKVEKKVEKEVEEGEESTSPAKPSSTDLDDFEELDDMEDLDSKEPTPTEPNILFDKSKQDHAAVLSGIIKECLPKTWKKDEDLKNKVRGVIAKLHSKVDVFTAKGEVLDSFTAFCKAELK